MVATGLSPQVVTETVYALAVQRRPRWLPSEVCIYTTVEGAARVREALLSEGQNWFGRLCSDYGLEGLRLKRSGIHLLRRPNGTPLRDIRNSDDSAAAADSLNHAIREFTADPESELHVSIAGGRKTMGFLAGYALSLHGRERDRLSHVLVDAAWEGHPEFFYPAKEKRVLYSVLPGKQRLLPGRARVELVEIPFVRMRNLIRARGGGPGSGFSADVESAQARVTALQRLCVDFKRRELRIGAKVIVMGAAEIAFGAMLARRTISGAGELEGPSAGCDPSIGEAFLREYRRLAGQDPGRTLRSLRSGMDSSYFLQRRARWDAAIRKQLGDAAPPYLVTTSGVRPHTRYSLGLPADLIFLTEEGRRS
ncbi:MAG: TIGR02584 family CRISPR-associated protein [Acidobacteria bacterium]|nr:TIGR02584 family CRISPR-associated protein [Acidobacteriota bacterium]